MNIKFYYDCEGPRADVWAMSSELTDNNDGTYSFKDDDIAEKIGTGSQIIVMDKPTIVLLYDADTKLAYDWSTAAANP